MWDSFLIVGIVAGVCALLMHPSLPRILSVIWRDATAEEADEEWWDRQW